MLGEIARRVEAGESWDATERAARRAVALHPNFASSYVALGAFAERNADGLDALQRALALWPASVPVRHQLASRRMAHGASTADVAALSDAAAEFAALARHGVDADYSKIVALQPDWRTTIAEVFNERIENCDYRDRDALFSRSARVLAAYDFQVRVSSLHLLYWPWTSGRAGRATRGVNAHTASRVRAAAPPAALPPSCVRGRRVRLNIAYAGADFREHVTLRLLLGVLEHHDASHFRVACLAFGRRGRRRTGGPLRERAAAACESLVELDGGGDEAARVRAEADILLDTNYKKGVNAPGNVAMAAARPAVSVNFLAHPATGGHQHYVATDRVAAPPALAPAFHERLVVMPAHYQVNAHAAEPRGRSTSRAAELGSGVDDAPIVAFAANPAKLSPEAFAGVAHALARTPRAVLWLVSYPLAPTDELSGEEARAAQRRRVERELHAVGVRSRRVLWSELAETAAHVGRAGLADVHVDGVMYNAHTTAADAVWAGVPHVTMRGEQMASRVGSAVVSAVGGGSAVTASLREAAGVVVALLVGGVRRLV